MPFAGDLSKSAVCRTLRAVTPQLLTPPDRRDATPRPLLEHVRGLAARPGLAFLDSASEADGLTLIAAEPEQIITGELRRDADKLRAVLRQRHGNGGLVGWVGFDGQFVFGVYPEIETHRASASDGETSVAISSGPRLHFEPQMGEDEFVKLVQRAKEYIAAGDIYQVNLSYPWLANWPAELEPFAFYERLRSASPAPHSAYLDLGGTQVFSASPECFLKMSGRRVITRPIKGTRPRGADSEGDQRLSAELLGSEKERAELIMITDLERNDLGQVCEFGSVRVSELLALERHAQVHHLVSTVEGTLRSDVDHLDAFIACFPGGSISGAPKKRALEIIHELEPHDRGLYTGAIGWFGFNGESQFNIAIRTAWRSGDVIQFHTGAGIVADSMPQLEYEETKHKAAGILAAART